MALLEVICRHEHDARRAAEGGADRIELLGSLDDGGISPEPVILARTVSAVDIPVRPMVRLRQGFSTDGGEIARLRGLIESYLDSGAEGVVMGFLDADTEVDVEHGLDELISMARSSPRAAELMMAGGGLAPEHVPWLMRAGVRAFHIGRPARPQGSYKAWVDAGLVHSWRTLLDSLD